MREAENLKRQHDEMRCKLEDSEKLTSDLMGKLETQNKCFEEEVYISEKKTELLRNQLNGLQVIFEDSQRQLSELKRQKEQLENMLEDSRIEAEDLKSTLEVTHK